MDRSSEGRQPVLVLLGPTAVGKTAISLEIASRLPGEVISADSRAFFKGLDIVTDKPSERERLGIPHHLIDIVSWRDTYDAMAFRRDVERLVPEICARGSVPIVAGGGTLYLGAILRGIFDGPARDSAIRAELEARSINVLYEQLRAADPVAAERIHPNDRLRIVRALEVHRLTGRPISTWQADATPLAHRLFVVGLQRGRDEHRAAIASRVRRMIDRGLLDEVARLHEEGLHSGCQAYRTIGVPEAMSLLEGRTSEREMEQQIIHRTWGLARRQTAFFRREKDVSWLDVTGRTARDVTEDILAAWATFLEADDVQHE